MKFKKLFKKKTKASPNNKHIYDFEALFVEFCNSDYDEAKGFMEDKYGKRYNAYMSKMCTGWKKRKDEWKSRTANKILDVLTDEKVKTYGEAIDLAIGEVKRRLSAPDEVKAMSPHDLRVLWEMVMTMAGKPSKIVRPVPVDDDGDEPDYNQEALALLEKYENKSTENKTGQEGKSPNKV